MFFWTSFGVLMVVVHSYPRGTVSSHSPKGTCSGDIRGKFTVTYSSKLFQETKYQAYAERECFELCKMEEPFDSKLYLFSISLALQEGYAAVHLAAMYSREETIRHLVQKKADINAAGGVSVRIQWGKIGGKGQG